MQRFNSARAANRWSEAVPPFCGRYFPWTYSAHLARRLSAPALAGPFEAAAAQPADHSVRCAIIHFRIALGLPTKVPHNRFRSLAHAARAAACTIDVVPNDKMIEAAINWSEFAQLGGRWKDIRTPVHATNVKGKPLPRQSASAVRRANIIPESLPTGSRIRGAGNLASKYSAAPMVFSIFIGRGAMQADLALCGP